MALLDEILGRLDALPEDQLQKLAKDVYGATKGQVWIANPGPQERAAECQADELFYGGQAGGGKTDLLCGLALTQHKRSLILRRTNKEASKLVERFDEILGHRDGWSGQKNCWRLPGGRIIDIGGCQHEDDKQGYKGVPRDFYGFDELPDFSETQYRFIIGWNRSTSKGQRCRVVAAGNPPTTSEGLWVIRYWAPWLDPNHPNPAKPGELRWFTTIAGEDIEVDGPGPHLVDGDMIKARSRTYIPASLSDNPDLSRTDYGSVVAAMPEPYRSAYKDGRFDVGLKDHEKQLIPTGWVFEAHKRWTPRPPDGSFMTAIGVDVSGGGIDSTQAAPRYDGWYGELQKIQVSSSEGNEIAAGIFKMRRDNCIVVIDMGGGFGGAPATLMRENGVKIVGFNGAMASSAMATDGSRLKFANKRAEAYYKFREALDPAQVGGSVIALPNDSELRADLTAPRFEITSRGVVIESKDDIKKRIGRSPDKGDAVVMAWSEGQTALQRGLSARSMAGHQSFAITTKRRR